MGSVYLAEDQELNRRIALKVPHFTRADGTDVLNRFRREAQAAARIFHPNLCSVYDIGEIDGIFYLTMAYIEGQSLAGHIQQWQPLNVYHALGIIRKTAQALTEAHAQGVIHRDLKPSNIMMNPPTNPSWSISVWPAPMSARKRVSLPPGPWSARWLMPRRNKLKATLNWMAHGHL